MTIFAIVMILVVGIVTFIHLLQGFFSAAISAVIAVIAAVLALSFHEAIAQKYLGGSFADISYTLTLLAMFAVIYLVGRTIFDAAVPGNLRLPPAADKIGGAIMGIIAGVFTAGIIAIAAQEMPFRGSIWGYARLSVDDSQVNVPTQRRAVERHAVRQHERQHDRRGQAERNAIHAGAGGRDPDRRDPEAQRRRPVVGRDGTEPGPPRLVDGTVRPAHGDRARRKADGDQRREAAPGEGGQRLRTENGARRAHPWECGHGLGVHAVPEQEADAAEGPDQGPEQPFLRPAHSRSIRRPPTAPG